MRKSLLKQFYTPLLIFLIFSGCKKNKEPSACFDLSSDKVFVGQDVEFTNCTDLGDSYLWDFGDGTSSSYINPIHSFTNGGTFNVELKATNEHGSHTYSRNITVNGDLPIGMKINRISITKWPTNNNGQAWDNDGSEVDLFPKITSSSKYIFVSSDFRTDCILGNEYSFGSNSGLPVTISDLSETIYVEWYDKDSSTSDPFIGSLGFDPMDITYWDKEFIFLENDFITCVLLVSWDH